MAYTFKAPEFGDDHETVLSQAGSAMIALGELIGDSKNIPLSEAGIHGIASILSHYGGVISRAANEACHLDRAWKDNVERAYAAGIAAGLDESCSRAKARQELIDSLSRARPTDGPGGRGNGADHARHSVRAEDIPDDVWKGATNQAGMIALLSTISDMIDRRADAGDDPTDEAAGDAEGDAGDAAGPTRPD